MRLYTNDKGEWVGTQTDARRLFGKDWREVYVPTDKTSLIEFLNFFAVGDSHVKPIDSDSVRTAVQSNSSNHPWQTIKECAEKASLKDLGVALSVVMNRLDAVAEGES
jgi:hypothetical protein